MSNTNQTIFNEFHNVAKLHSDKKIIAYKEGTVYQWLRYADLFGSIQRLTTAFSLLRLKPRDHIAICLDSSPLWMTSLLACFKLSCVAVPLNPQLNRQELKHILNHANVQTIVTQEKYLPLLEPIAERLDIRVIDTSQILAQTQRQPTPVIQESMEARSSDVAAIIYTSGTTATPKGVELTHANLLANISSLQKLQLLNPDDCLLSVLPFYHAYPFMVTLLFPLLSRVKVSFAPGLDASSLLECITNTDVTALIGVPRVFALLADSIQRSINNLPLLKRTSAKSLFAFNLFCQKQCRLNMAPVLFPALRHRFGKLRLMISGGAKLEPAVAEKFLGWGFLLLEGYGLTETSPVVSFNTPSKRKTGSVGKPIPGVEIKISKPQHTGIGEVIIKGDNVMKGYHKEPTATAERIRDGWFYTGDLGSIDQGGFLHIQQRKDEAIVLSSGKKINPQEEEHLYEQSPFIKELCVFASADPKSRSAMLRAIIVPDYDCMREHGIYQVKDRIRLEIEHLSRQLPHYKRISQYNISTEALPRTPLGKLKRYVIMQQYSSAAAPGSPSATSSTELPDLLKHPLAKQAYDFLCAESNKQVRLEDDLEIDLGFDSLQQITLLAEFERMSGELHYSDDDLMRTHTVRDVLKRLNTESVTATTPMPQSDQPRTNQWRDIFATSIPDSVKESIKVRMSVLDRIINICFVLIGRFFMLLFRVEIRGIENIPEHGPLLFCPNHASYLDAPLLFSYLPFRTILQLYFVGYRAYFEHPCVRWAKQSLRLIPIEASLEVTKSLQSCKYALDEKKFLCFFPEGMRSPNGKLQQFKSGIGILIQELQVPVLPVYIQGSFDAWPSYRRFPRPRKITVTIGQQLTPQQLSGTIPADNESIYSETAKQLEQHVRAIQSSL